MILRPLTPARTGLGLRYRDPLCLLLLLYHLFLTNIYFLETKTFTLALLFAGTGMLSDDNSSFEDVSSSDDSSSDQIIPHDEYLRNF